MGKRIRVLIRLAKDYLWSYLAIVFLRSYFRDIRCFILFVGYPRSGHSLIGSLLDAHPNVIIAQELNALQYFTKGFSKEQVFSLLIKNSKEVANKGRQSTGYSYVVQEQHQGKFNKLSVIGDKKGWASSLLLQANSDLRFLLNTKIKIKIKYIHIYRNPFDNITTWARGGNRKKNVVDERNLLRVVDQYFESADMVSILRDDPNVDLIDLKHEDFIKNPRLHLAQLCSFIGVEASSKYLNSCSRIVFTEPKITRYSIFWPQKIVEDVYERMSKHPLLRDYRYEI
ncbi:sulfotransferase domain-containing protein [Perlabentimonas gracilis]|uniref:sulfotransferase domain-containing protein n=1 Tax=Perlabentimonas gracilis TaxID=2715279 RepID=UPI001408009E|nr:sulfotransferase domain-containing protein [Perlabentimonas gracilis]NHB67683.1 sulfotransferase [Perlabentimonas gracilis]